MTHSYTSHSVLITGASSGIGREFALAFAARGADLVLVARREERLRSLAADIRSEHGVVVHVIPFDVSTPTAGADLLAAVHAAGARVTGLINNAGFGTFSEFVGEDARRVASEIAVDVSAPVQLSSAFLPELAAANKGFLINVASMAAYTPTPRMAVYGATKAFVLSFTEALWYEFRGSGLTVFALSPGATSTEFNAVVGTDDATAGARARPASSVVATALKHLERRNPGPSVIDGRGNRAAAGLMRLFTRRAAASFMGRLTDPSRRR